MLYKMVFQWFPDIKLIFGHCGGALPALSGWVRLLGRVMGTKFTESDPRRNRKAALEFVRRHGCDCRDRFGTSSQHGWDWSLRLWIGLRCAVLNLKHYEREQSRCPGIREEVGPVTRHDRAGHMGSLSGGDEKRAEQGGNRPTQSPDQ